MKIFATLILLLALLTSCAGEQVLVITERGGQHESFAAAGLEWLNENGKEMGFTVTEINSTEPIDKEYLDRFDLIVQLDFPPYTWTDTAAEAFISYIEPYGKTKSFSNLHQNESSHAPTIFQFLTANSVRFAL